MALLPHELRALRLRQALMAVVGVLVLATVVLVLSLTRQQLAALARVSSGGEAGSAAEAGRSATVATAPATAPATQPVVAAAPGETQEPEPEASVELAMAASTRPPPLTADGQAIPLERVVKPFGQARGFRDALTRAGASGADADALIAALDEQVDFRHGQPDHELIFERDSAKTLQRFEYRASVTERYRAERHPDGKFVGERVKVDIERRKIAKGGYISDSLGNALEALALKNSLAGVFVEAFEGKIDFKRDARQGDSFRVVVEEEYVEGKLLGLGRIQAIQYSGARSGDAFAFWHEESDGSRGDFYDENGRALHGGWLRTPLRYDHVSSGYNLRRRHPILKRIVPHHGIDYAAPPGTMVWAAGDGVVTFAGPRGANGNLVAIKHPNGYETYYAHLLRTARGVARGARVEQRQPIGAVGSTGRSTGPHLHFALKRNGRFIDPIGQLNGPGKLLPEAQLPKFKRQVVQLKRDLADIALAAAPAPAAETPSPAEDLAEAPIDL